MISDKSFLERACASQDGFVLPNTRMAWNPGEVEETITGGLHEVIALIEGKQVAQNGINVTQIRAHSEVRHVGGRVG
jgi:hypothetical protein